MSSDSSILSSLIKLNQLLSDSLRRRFLVWTFLGSVFSLLEVAGLGAILPVFMKLINPDQVTGIKFLDESKLFNSIDSHSAFIFLGILLAFFTTKGLIQLVISQNRHKVNFSIARHLSQINFNSLRDQGFIRLKNLNEYEYIHKVHSVPIQVSNTIINSLNRITETAFSILWVILLLSLFDIGLLIWVILTLTPLVASLYYISLRGSSGYDKKRMSLAPRIGSVLAYIYHNIKNLLSTDRLSFPRSKFESSQEEQIQALEKVHIFNELPSRFMEAVIIAGIFCLVLYSNFMEQNSTQLVLSLGIYATMASKLIPSMNRLTGALMILRNNVFLLDEIENNKAVPYLAQDAVEADSLELSNVSFSFPGSETLLNNINLKWSKGEVIGIKGLSGAGKSTLAAILSGSIKPDMGTILINDEVLNKVPERLFILDSYAPQLWTSPGESITLQEHREIDLKKLKFSLEQAGVDDLFENQDQLFKAWDAGIKLSEGQKQRMRLATLFYHDADWIILDETTSHLDVQTEHEVLSKLYYSCHNESKYGIMIISHRDSALNHADHVYELKNGALKSTVNEFD